MVCRRWRGLMVVVVLAALPAALPAQVVGGLGGAAASSVTTAGTFESSPAREMPGLRKKVLDTAPQGAGDKEKWAEGVCKDYTKAGVGINSGNSDARLNIAIMLHELHTVSSEDTLIVMLTNKDPAVRYWGARGLGAKELSDKIKQVGGSYVAKAVKGLQTQAGNEDSGPVAQEIVKALVVYADPAALLAALDAIGKKLQAGTPEVSLLQTAVVGLDALTTLVSSASAADKEKAAGVAAKLASFAAQQQAKYAESLKNGGETLPQDYADATQGVVEAAVRVANAAGGGGLKVGKAASPAQLLVDVNNTFGMEGKPGELQRKMPQVGIPPAVGVAATGPATQEK
jgi:hypothetical protein